MGIDPGLTRCGLSVVQSGKGRAIYPVSVGVIRTPSDAPLTERLLRISHAVREWIDDYQPDVVAIERLFERGNVSTVMHTAHAVGVLMLAAAERGLTAMVTRILGLSEPPKPADAADALALAICHCWRAPALAQQEQLLKKSLKKGS